MSWENLKVDKKDDIATVTINRPKALNALNVETLSELVDAFEELKEDDDIGGVLLTGSGEKAFVAGADIAQMRDMDVREARDFSDYGQNTLLLIESMPKPVIAVVNGYALGGGLEIAMACDIILASEKALFGQPEIKLGIIPGFGGTQRLMRRAGMNIAKELIFTGGMIDAGRALAIGLVNAVYPAEKLMDEAIAMMKIILANGPIAVEMAKSAINTGANQTITVGMALERDAFATCFATEDQKEGMTAFLEKRDPEFKCR